MAAFTLLAGFVVFAAAVSRHAAEAKAVARAAAAEAVVVLTGGESRVHQALALFEQAQVRRLLISGVHPQTTRDDLRRRTGLPEALFSCCVDIGYAATDTTGNARETREWAEAWGFKRVVVVTSSYHMPRGLLEIGHQLPAVDLVPHAVVPRGLAAGPWWTNTAALRLLGLEYAKSLVVLARHGAELMTAGAAPRPVTGPTAGVSRRAS